MVADSTGTVTAPAQINHPSDVNPDTPHKMSSNKSFCPFDYKTKDTCRKSPRTYMDAFTVILKMNTHVITTTVKT